MNHIVPVSTPTQTTPSPQTPTSTLLPSPDIHHPSPIELALFPRIHLPPITPSPYSVPFHPPLYMCPAQDCFFSLHPITDQHRKHAGFAQKHDLCSLSQSVNICPEPPSPLLLCWSHKYINVHICTHLKSIKMMHTIYEKYTLGSAPSWSMFPCGTTVIAMVI